MKRFKKLIPLLLVVCLLGSIMSGCVSGCDWFSESINFNQSQISIVYGETVDLAEYIEVSGRGSGVYTLSASNGVVEVVSNSGIKAVGTGDVTVTARLASGGESSAEITVSFAEPTSLTLFETGELYQLAASAAAVTFSALLNEGTDPSAGIRWFLDGEEQSTSATQYTPPVKKTAGQYTVKAQHRDNADIFAEKTVRIYNNFVLPAVIYAGEEIYETLTPVTFDFDEIIGENIAQNPEYLFEMYVDGVLEQSIHSFDPAFSFEPKSAGIYSFAFKLNGKPILTEGGESEFTVCFKGVITPFGLSLDFDSDYPSVYLSWQNNEDTEFTVVIESGGKTETITDISATDGRVDIGSKIDLTKNCTVKVKSEDFGDYFLGSDFVVITHEAINSSAISYLAQKSVGGNFYMTDDDEVLAIFDYMLVFRPNAKKAAENSWVSECTMYMGYSSTKSTSAFSVLFRDRLTITGMYKWSVLGNTGKGKTVTLSMSFLSAAEPTNDDISKKLTHKVLLAPQVSQIGQVVDRLPVDFYPTSPETVETTNQLFYALENGFYPNCKQGSTAERIFNSAREALLSITDSTMNEAQTARAIFDWVMFKVSYDDEVVSYGEINHAVLQPAYYPEGVFDFGFAVCDGISKTYSIMCNMMGIKCIRVIGKANGGEHAWNKLIIGGKWYMADATWGLIKARLGGNFYKAGTHEYFLITDADTIRTHVEVGLTYPKTASTPYNWFIKTGNYIYDTQDLTTQCEAIAAEITAKKADKKFTVQGQTFTANYAAFEYKVAGSLIKEFQNDGNTLTKLLVKNGLSYEYLVVGTTIIIAVK